MRQPSTKKPCKHIKKMTAGLRPGDIVVSFNGTAITDGGPLTRMIQDAAIGSTASVEVIRDGRRIQLKIPIGRATEQ